MRDRESSPQYGNIIGVSEGVVVRPHEEGLHPDDLPVLALVLAPTPPPSAGDLVSPGHYEAAGRVVEVTLLIIETVPGGEDVVTVQDTSSTGVVIRSEIDLSTSQSIRKGWVISLTWNGYL